jgi:hypothetical protein
MKGYLAYLLIISSSIWMVMPTVAIAKPNPSTATPASSTTKVISPTAALERLIIAKKLEASWFTPEFLKAADLSTIQFQRDLSLKLGTMRYGNYKSVQLVKGDKYRIIFDRAEPDAVIAKFQIDASGRIAGVGIAEKNKPEPNAQAQAGAEAAVDRSFKTNIGSNGKPNQLFISLKQWLGNYQKVEKQDASNYSGIFDRGSVPVTVNFKPDGSIESFGMGCPTTKSLSLSQAPTELQQRLSKCPNLK